MNLNNYWLKNNIRSKTDITSETENRSYNPLRILPFEIRMDLTSNYYETGRTSLTQEFFSKTAEKEDIVPLLQKIYYFAVKRDNHMLIWNIMVVLSQIPYTLLGEGAAILALAATRTKYMDVIEMGIRCYENWEDKEACTFLDANSFSEKWLQEYAEEVCAYVREEGVVNVLSEKDYSWKMAVRREYTAGNTGKCGCGYSCS